MTKSSQVTVVPVYRDMFDYVAACRATSQADPGRLWTEIVVDRRWSEWAAGQVNEERTRPQLAQAPDDLDILADRARHVAKSNIESVIKSSYARINGALPAPIDRAVCVWVDPKLGLAEHGVVGTSLGDNILIRINPVEDDWLAWVPYVLAHESHHCYWGYQHFCVEQRTRFDFGTSLIIEGEADSLSQMARHDTPATRSVTASCRLTCGRTRTSAWRTGQTRNPRKSSLKADMTPGSVWMVTARAIDEDRDATNSHAIAIFPAPLLEGTLAAPASRGGQCTTAFSS